jgi:mannose-6-phosphate isomerase
VSGRRAPLQLEPNLVRRAYRRGEAIAELRGLPADHAAPEDWVGSTTHAGGDSETGFSTVEGRPLPGLVAEDPDGFFGPGQAAQPGLLLKLLDAGERRMAHRHPDRGFAEARGRSTAELALGPRA